MLHFLQLSWNHHKKNIKNTYKWKLYFSYRPARINPKFLMSFGGCAPFPAQAASLLIPADIAERRRCSSITASLTVCLAEQHAGECVQVPPFFWLCLAYSLIARFASFFYCEFITIRYWSRSLSRCTNWVFIFLEYTY